MVVADAETKAIYKYVVRTDHGYSESEHQGLSQERWNQYQTLLHGIGIDAVGSGGTKIWFRVEIRGESEKGLVYSDVSPTPILKSLDDFSPSESTRTTDHGDYRGYKNLEGNWYLWAGYY